MNDKPEHVREALLDNGRIVEYDVCSHDKYGINDQFYLLLGAGTIFKINGAAVSDKGRKFFWTKKKKEQE